MKKALFFLMCYQGINACYALGPNELMFNNLKYIKQVEKSHDHTLSAEYTPINKSSSKVILHHVLDKNEPHAVLNSLKKNKTVEIVEVEDIDNTSLLVTFIKFDQKNAKADQNLCRIMKSATHKGSIVLQYVNTQKMKGQGEGIKSYDFTEASDSMKQMPLEDYISTLSQYLPPKAKEIPWYDRPGAWAGRDEYLRRKYNRNFFPR